MSALGAGARCLPAGPPVPACVSPGPVPPAMWSVCVTTGGRSLPLLLLLSSLCAKPSAAVPSTVTGEQNHRMRSDWSLHDNEYVLAYINVTYGDPTTGGLLHQGGEIGKYSTGLVASARGTLVHVRSRNGTAHHGCDEEWENMLPPTPQPWVALIRRGFCNFDVKVENAYRNNASAVIIYNYNDESELHRIHLTRRHSEYRTEERNRTEVTHRASSKLLRMVTGCRVRCSQCLRSSRGLA